jgi:hypothetical protein
MPLSPQEKFALQKSVWTEADFDKMGWHDVVIHGISFNPSQYELLFDIDYIFAWVNPDPPSEYFSFWVSPATLVFRNAYDLKVNIETGLGLQLQGIERNEEREPRNAAYIKDKKEWRWTLEGNEGDILFYSVGFTQHTRQYPKHIKRQSFTLEERGGISFERPEKPKDVS